MARIFALLPSVMILCGLAALAGGCERGAGPEDGGAALSVRGDRLFVQAVVNGHETEALLDSAAEISLLDSSFARSIGIAAEGADVVKGSGGEQEVAFASGVAIVAVGRRLDDLTVAVLDLSDISTRLIGEPITTVLGREIFDSGRLEVDIARGVIRTVDDGRVPPGEALELREQHGVEAFYVTVDGAQSVLAEFDLGNGSEVLIGAQLAERLGLAEEHNIVERRTGGGIGGAREREIVIIPSLIVAGVTFENVEAAIDRTENASDINLGVSVLRRFLMTVDFPQRRIWLEPY